MSGGNRQWLERKQRRGVERTASLRGSLCPLERLTQLLENWSTLGCSIPVGGSDNLAIIAPRALKEGEHICMHACEELERLRAVHCAKAPTRSTYERMQDTPNGRRGAGGDQYGGVVCKACKRRPSQRDEQGVRWRRHRVQDSRVRVGNGMLRTQGVARDALRCK